MSAGADLDAILAEARTAIQAAGSAQDLAEVRSRFLGKKGSVAAVLRGIGTLAPEERGSVGQAANQDLLAEVLAAVDRGNAVDDHTGRHVLPDEAARGRLHAITKNHMVPHPHLAPQDHIRAQLRTAGNPRLGHDHAMRTNVYIMSDLHQVINFRPLPDPRFAEARTR